MFHECRDVTWLSRAPCHQVTMSERIWTDTISAPAQFKMWQFSNPFQPPAQQNPLPKLFLKISKTGGTYLRRIAFEIFHFIKTRKKAIDLGLQESSTFNIFQMAPSRHKEKWLCVTQKYVYFESLALSPFLSQVLITCQDGTKAKALKRESHYPHKLLICPYLVLTQKASLRQSHSFQNGFAGICCSVNPIILHGIMTQLFFFFF